MIFSSFLSSSSSDENDNKKSLSISSSSLLSHISTKSPSKKINSNNNNGKQRTFKAVLFDMDGVLASVGNSYRQAIIQTGEHFGVKITHEDISIEKKKG